VVEPNIHFQEAAIASGTANGTPYTDRSIDPFKTRLDGGLGTQLADKKLLLAADWDDIGNSTGFAQLGFGAEYKLYGTTALRAGYNTHAGYTVGASIFGINVALSARRTLIVGTEVRF
jgi:hypothetical protein